MTALREVIRITAMAAIAAGTFCCVQGYLTAKEELAQEQGQGAPAPPATVAVRDQGDISKPMSPLFPVIPAKYLIGTTEKGVAKPRPRIAAAVHHPKTALLSQQAARVKKKRVPLELAASHQEQQIAYGYAPEPRENSPFSFLSSP